MTTEAQPRKTELVPMQPQPTRVERIFRHAIDSPRVTEVAGRIVRSPRTKDIVSGIVGSKSLEKGLRRKMDKLGFLEVHETEEVAQQARVDTLKAVWALKGLGDRMLRSTPNIPLANPENPRIPVIQDALSGLTDGMNLRVDALMRRLTKIPERKALLETVLTDATSEDPDKSIEAKKRLATVVDIVDGVFDKKNPGGRKAVILTQTAYLLGAEEKTKAEGVKEDRVNKLKKLAIEMAAGSVPYMGAAVLYSELMATGKFSDIEFIDFHDSKKIDAMLKRGDREFAFISGATTFDGTLVEGVNQKLYDAGLTVVNGGVAAGIETEPQKHFLDKGGSVFVGDLEGAADQLVEKLIQMRDEGNNEERVVFVRKGFSRTRQLRSTGVEMVEIGGLSERALLHREYNYQREITEGRLADRLIALEMMRGDIHYGDKSYEQPPKYKFHQTAVSYGCPEKCDFCATVPLQGVNMRQRTLESLQLEWEAAESPTIAIVDQNFCANGRDYVTEVLTLAEKLKKRVGFEGELLFFSDPTGKPWETIQRSKPVQFVGGLAESGVNLLARPQPVGLQGEVSEASEAVPQEFYFDGTDADRKREQLLYDVVLGVEVGLETPQKVSGTIKGGKDPRFFQQALGKLAQIGVPVFGTVVIGMPEQLFEDKENTDTTIIPTQDKLGTPDWDEMVAAWTHWMNEIKVPAPLVFGFSTYRGTKQHADLVAKGLLDPETADNPYPQVKGMETLRAVNDVTRQVYTLKSARERLQGGNYDFARLWKLYLYNLVAGKAFRDEMG